SPNAQGRSDLQTYRTALNTCLNLVLLEEGAVTRRPGFLDLGPTAYNQPSIIRRLDWQGNLPIGIETSYGGSAVMRFWFWDGYKYKLAYDDTETVTSFSAANPTVMTIASAHASWGTGDLVFIEVDGAINANKAPQLAN